MTQPATEPLTALARAHAQAARALRERLLEAGWPPEVADGLARVAAEVCTNAAWPLWKHSISAWKRPPTERTP